MHPDSPLLRMLHASITLFNICRHAGILQVYQQTFNSYVHSLQILYYGVQLQVQDMYEGVCMNEDGLSGYMYPRWQVDEQSDTSQPSDNEKDNRHSQLQHPQGQIDYTTMTKTMFGDHMNKNCLSSY